MGTHKHMEEIVLAGSEEESRAMITAGTVLDSNTEYDWKIHHTGSMKKLEDRFNKELNIPIAKQPPTVKDNNSATMQAVASALRGKCFLELTIDFPSTNEVEELAFSRNPTITADNISAYHPTHKDLDVKLPATTKTDDVLMEDLVPTSIPSPHTTTNRIGVGEQLHVSHDLKNFHVFNDNNKMNSNENIEQEHPKMKVTNQQKDAVIESELVSWTTTTIINLDHTKEFQECMDS